MAENSEKSSSRLPGLRSHFFGDVSYGNALALRQNTVLHQNLSAQKTAATAASLGAHETRAVRESIEGSLAPSMHAVATTNMEMRHDIHELQGSVEEGMQHVGNRIDAASERITGMPLSRTHIGDLMRHGYVYEGEAIAMAFRHQLTPQARQDLQASLPPWKVNLIRNGSNIGRKLSRAEEAFLERIQRKLDAPIESFGSLNALARNGHIDGETHRALANAGVEAVMVGTDGITYAQRVTNRKLGTLTDQAEMIAQQGTHAAMQRNHGLAKQDTLITQQKAGLALQGIQVAQGKALVDVERQSLAVQTRSDSRLAELTAQGIRAEGQRTAIAKHTAGTERNTALSAELQARALPEIIANRSANEATRDNTGALVGFAARADIDRKAALAELSSLHGTVDYYGREAQSTRLVQVGLAQADLVASLERNKLLNSIGGQLETLDDIDYGIQCLQEVAVDQLYAIDGLRTDVASLERAVDRQGEAIQRSIGVVGQIIEAHGATVDAAIRYHSERTSAAIVYSGEQTAAATRDVAGAIRESERGAMYRAMNSDRIRADEKFRTALHMQKGHKILEAIALYDESQGIWPADYRVYLNRGLCHSSEEDLDMARRDFRDACSLACEPDQNRVREIALLYLARLSYSEARIAYSNGDFEKHDEKMAEAVQVSVRAASENPRSIDAHFALARYTASLNMFDEALKIALRLIKIQPKIITKFSADELFLPLRAPLRRSLYMEIYLKDREDPEINEKILFNVVMDLLEIKDGPSAVEFIEILIKKYPSYLNKMKFWELEGFEAIRSEVLELVANSVQHSEYQNAEAWYSISAIALHLGASRGIIVRAFDNGVKKDPLDGSQFFQLRSNLRQIFGEEKYNELVSIVRSVFPPLHTWLT